MNGHVHWTLRWSPENAKAKQSSKIARQTNQKSRPTWNTTFKTVKHGHHNTIEITPTCVSSSTSHDLSPISPAPFSRLSNFYAWAKDTQGHQPQPWVTSNGIKPCRASLALLERSKAPWYVRFFAGVNLICIITPQKITGKHSSCETLEEQTHGTAFMCTFTDSNLQRMVSARRSLAAVKAASALAWPDKCWHYEPTDNNIWGWVQTIVTLLLVLPKCTEANNIEQPMFQNMRLAYLPKPQIQELNIFFSLSNRLEAKGGLRKLAKKWQRSKRLFFWS